MSPSATKRRFFLFLRFLTTRTFSTSEKKPSSWPLPLQHGQAPGFLLFTAHFPAPAANWGSGPGSSGTAPEPGRVQVLDSPDAGCTRVGLRGFCFMENLLLTTTCSSQDRKAARAGHSLLSSWLPLVTLCFCLVESSSSSVSLSTGERTTASGCCCSNRQQRATHTHLQ